MRGCYGLSGTISIESSRSRLMYSSKAAHYAFRMHLSYRLVSHSSANTHAPAHVPHAASASLSSPAAHGRASIRTAAALAHTRLYLRPLWERHSATQTAATAPRSVASRPRVLQILESVCRFPSLQLPQVSCPSPFGRTNTGLSL